MCGGRKETTKIVAVKILTGHLSAYILPYKVDNKWRQIAGGRTNYYSWLDGGNISAFLAIDNIVFYSAHDKAAIANSSQVANNRQIGKKTKFSRHYTHSSTGTNGTFRHSIFQIYRH